MFAIKFIFIAMVLYLLFFFARVAIHGGTMLTRLWHWLVGRAPTMQEREAGIQDEWIRPVGAWKRVTYFDRHIEQISAHLLVQEGVLRPILVHFNQPTATVLRVPPNGPYKPPRGPAGRAVLEVLAISGLRLDATGIRAFTPSTGLGVDVAAAVLIAATEISDKDDLEILPLLRQEFRETRLLIDLPVLEWLTSFYAGHKPTRDWLLEHASSRLVLRQERALLELAGAEHLPQMRRFVLESSASADDRLAVTRRMFQFASPAERRTVARSFARRELECMLFALAHLEPDDASETTKRLKSGSVEEASHALSYLDHHGVTYETVLLEEIGRPLEERRPQVLIAGWHRLNADAERRRRWLSCPTDAVIQTTAELTRLLPDPDRHNAFDATLSAIAGAHRPLTDNQLDILSSLASNPLVAQYSHYGDRIAHACEGLSPEHAARIARAVLNAAGTSTPPAIVEVLRNHGNYDDLTPLRTLALSNGRASREAAQALKAVEERVGAHRGNVSVIDEHEAGAMSVVR